MKTKTLNDSNNETILQKILNKIKNLDPVALFPNNLIAAKFYFYAFFVAVIIIAIEPFPFFAMMQNREMVTVMDDFGGCYRGVATSFKEATTMHKFYADLAAGALLSRNPNGPDKPGLLKQMYLKTPYSQIMQHYKKTNPLFKKEDIHQKCEVVGRKVEEASDGYVMMCVTGQLIRSGKWNGVPFVHGYHFTLRLRLMRNPRFGNNLRLPYAASWFNLQTKLIKKGEGNV